MITLRNHPQGEPFTSPLWTKWFSALVLAFNRQMGSGSTALRPNPAPFVGFMYFDTTLNRPVWAKTLTQYVFHDGTNA